MDKYSGATGAHPLDGPGDYISSSMVGRSQLARRPLREVQSALPREIDCGISLLASNDLGECKTEIMLSVGLFYILLN